MILRLYLLACTLSICFNLFAQQQQSLDCLYTIEGQVYDAATKEPLAFVGVKRTDLFDITLIVGTIFASCINLVPWISGPRNF